MKNCRIRWKLTLVRQHEKRLQFRDAEVQEESKTSMQACIIDSAKDMK